MLKQTDAVLLAWLSKAIAATGPYDPASTFLGVGTAVEDHGVNTVLADITEGAGALATRVAMTAWGAPYKLADGRWAVDGPPAHFRPADVTEQQTVAVMFYASAAVAGTLKAFNDVVPSVSLLDENYAVTIYPRLTIDPAGNFSAEVVIDG